MVRALRNLALPVRFQGPGPFRALSDGNAMLQPLGLGLRYVRDVSVCRGKFVLWHDAHFVGVEATETLVVFDGSR